MSNVETQPEELHCPPDTEKTTTQLLSSREVPLGGPRGITVRRTLPQRARTFIGAWCFVDHYGPHDVRDGGGMRVAPHPHTGLQTVSWLFAGEVEHRDSHGVHAMVRPGELNLMTGGRGICHSEVSTPSTEILHGVQMWVALPAEHRDDPRDFQHYVPPVLRHDGAEFLVFLGTLVGHTSPVRTATPLLGAQIVLEPGARCVVPVDASFEHGVLVDQGEIHVDGSPVSRAELWVRSPGAHELTLVNDTLEPARLLLLGGPPFDEEIVMWWNFVGRSHAEIVEYRTEWQQESERFGVVEGYDGTPQRLPAPPLPNGEIRPRGN